MKISDAQKEKWEYAVTICVILGIFIGIIAIFIKC